MLVTNAERAELRSVPLRIIASRQMKPLQILTLRAKRGRRVRNVSIEINGLSSPWGAEWGDPVTEHPHSLSGATTLDLVLNIYGRSDHRLQNLQEGTDRSVRAQDDVILIVRWESEARREDGGRFGLFWTAIDRSRGRAPFIVPPQEIERLTQAPGSSNVEVPAIFRRRYPRVRRASPRRPRTRSGKEGQMDGVGSVSVYAERMTVRGLRGFREDATLRLAKPNGRFGSGLTIVVGENNAGKSTIWEAFDALARKMRSDVSFSEGRRNRLSPGGVRIQLEKIDGSTFVLESRNADTSETRSHWEPGGDSAGAAFELVSVPARRQFQPSFGKSGMVARDWMFSSGEFSRARQSDQFSQFTGRLFDLHNDDTKKRRFDELMTEVIGHELKWSIELSDGQYGQSYYLKVSTGEGVSHTSDGLGDGIISLMFIVNALYDSEPSTLLTIDEPELSLHPQLVRRLGRLISRLSADRQIVIFTHSPDLVSWDDLQAGGEVARVYKSRGESKLAQASRDAIDGVTKARGGWSNPHALGADANSALFLDDGVIVVEGQEDAVLLPRVFENLGIAPNGTIFGWGSGGADNVGRFLHLLQDLGFTRVVAVLDDDVPHIARTLRETFGSYLVVEQPAADIRDKPAKNFAGKEGLLDKRGKQIKPHLEAKARAVCQEISDRLRSETGAGVELALDAWPIGSSRTDRGD